MKVLPSTELSESLSSFLFLVVWSPISSIFVLLLCSLPSCAGSESAWLMGRTPMFCRSGRERFTNASPACLQCRLNPLTSPELKAMWKRLNSKSQSNFFPADLLVLQIKGSEFSELLRPSGTLMSLRLALWFFVWLKFRSSGWCGVSSVNRCLSAVWEVLDVSRGDLRMTESWKILS